MRDDTYMLTVRKLRSARIDIKISCCGTGKPILSLFHPGAPGQDAGSVLPASCDEVSVVGGHPL